ncbi:MAG: 23S rRNA (uracil(1939)-C(5))-methyltransferase RlmD [Candidatus Kapabacteria bacterium]|nr:23S rRNA (uracil(1939)-C(5))-methyltransferase RlmD [Ignavibacteriota bacterium]MCW5884316.1 23S rRNA (uracil(1939)-C(5))-methyltransferase RlmD [Candidatus Kapabacteria bacterium]
MSKFYNSPSVELDIESAGFEGVCISKYNEKVVFTKYTVPGDKVLAVIQKNRRRFNEAKVEKILEESPHRISPQCKHFGMCGGCSWQNVSYDKQLEIKSQNVIDLFQRIGGVDVGEYLPIVGAEKDFSYRNKMEFSFGASRWLSEDEINSGLPITDKDFAFGMHLPGRFDKIIDIKSCEIQQPYANEILNAVRLYSRDYGLNAYNVRTHNGFLRGLIIRHSKLTDEFTVILMTKTAYSDAEKKFIDWFSSDFAGLFTKVANVVHAINESKNPVGISSFEVIKGDGFLRENILDVEFKISPFSFFQTNSHQLNKFIKNIVDSANIKESDTVWDLFCGTGSITLPASKFAKKVIGIELVESSINDAIENALLNNLTNVEFYSADLNNKKIPMLLNQLDKPDVVIFDPPRAGMSPNLINHILEIEPPRLVYVSCNPATQARDVSLMSEKYSVVTIQPFDMFPQTYHIESIVVLQLKG